MHKLHHSLSMLCLFASGYYLDLRDCSCVHDPSDGCVLCSERGAHADALCACGAGRRRAAAAFAHATRRATARRDALAGVPVPAGKQGCSCLRAVCGELRVATKAARLVNAAPLLSCSTAQLVGERVSGCVVRNIPRERPGRPSLCARQGSNEGGDRRALRASAGALMPCTDARAIAFVVCKGVCFSVCVLIVAMLFCVMFSLSVCAHVCFCNSIRIGMRSCGDVCAVLLLLWSMCSRVRGALREGGCRL